MKPAPDPQENGVIETRTTRRIIPVSETQEAKNPDVWEYLRSITPQQWSKHIVYVYRIEPGPRIQILRTGESVLTMPSGRRVNLTDEQEVEYALTQEFGGGVFRMLVKNGPQIIAAGNLEIGVPPRAIRLPVEQSGTNGAHGATVTPISSSDVSQIAGKAIDAVAGQETLGIRVGVEALNAAANLQALAASTIKSFATNPAPAPAPPSETDQMFKLMMMKWMEKMMDRADAPVPTNFPGLNNDMVGRFFSTVIERGLNPPVATNGNSVSGVAAVASVLPQVLSYGAQIAAEIRMKAEADRDTVIAARSPQPPQMQAQPPAPRPQVLPPAAPAPAPNPNGADGMQGPSTEFVESRIIQILQQPTSAEEAADAVLMFLHTIDGPDQPAGEGSVAQLVKLGESGLVQLFNFRPKLKPATANMPRLLEFIRAFLKLYAEDQQADAASPQTPPPLPN